MKKFLQTTVCLLVLWFLFLFPAEAKDMTLRGVWVSTVYDLDYPSAPGLSSQALKQEADRIIENAKSWGMNAVFLQVRPCADAFYPSKTQPWSQWLSGKQGQAPDGGFDPLSYYLNACHASGLELHAWINPYRITRKAAATREEAFSQLCENHPARALADCVVFHTDGCLYYDPGKPEVRQHLLACAEEILNNYDVDGLHMDDYFYPGDSFDDAETFAQYGKSFSDIGDFRRDAVNQLVSSLHALTKKLRPNAVFGISPAGIWATSASHELGAHTVGSQSYFDHFADSRRWVREGMLDYIIPQIYWEIGAPAGDFQVMLDWWSDVARDTDVKLYIGIAAYKSAQAEIGSVWEGSDEILRQLALIEQSDTACGAVFFRYRSIIDGGLSACLQVPVMQDPAPVIRPENRFPASVTVKSPENNTAVLSGKAICVACEAPRGASVTAFWGNRYQFLKPDFCGNYSGNLTVEAAYNTLSETAPILLCAEKHGVLFVRLTPATVTAVRAETPAHVISAETLLDSGVDYDLKQLTLKTDSPCAAEFSLSGDILTLCLTPCESETLFQSDLFSEVSLTRQDNTVCYRMVLPTGSFAWQAAMQWSPDSIRLNLKKTPRAPAEAHP